MARATLLVCALVLSAAVSHAAVISYTKAPCTGSITCKLDEATGVLTIAVTGSASQTLVDVSDRGAPWYNDRGLITSIVIDDKITSIGKFMFAQLNRVTSIHLPSSLKTIKSNALRGLSDLTSIEIPTGVNVIENYAFAYDINLLSIEIPEGVTTIEDATFKGCESLTSVVIPESVKTIGKWGFAFCSALPSVQLPSQLEKIGDEAFRGCRGITSIEVPKTVTDFGYNAFRSCSRLKTFVYNGDTSLDRKPKTVFNGCPQLVDVFVTPDFPDDDFGGKPAAYVFPCGDDVLCAFSKKTGKLRVLGTGAVADLAPNDDPTWVDVRENVTSIVIEEGVTEIGTWAFANCPNLEAVEIAGSVTAIANNAFANCPKLGTVEYFGKTDPGPSSNGVFDGDTKMNSVYVPYDYTGSQFCKKPVIKRDPPFTPPPSDSEEPLSSGAPFAFVPSSVLVVVLAAALSRLF